MTPSHVTVLASGVLWWHGWKWNGSFVTLDLIAAFTNALNGALLARRPDHYKNFTVVGIILMAFLMGLGGGITRDVLLDKIPGALTNPAYIARCPGGRDHRLLRWPMTSGQLFREGLFQFMTSFSLPLVRDRRRPGGRQGWIAGPRRARRSLWSVRLRAAGMSTCPAACRPSSSSAASGSSTIALLTGIDLGALRHQAGWPPGHLPLDRVR